MVIPKTPMGRLPVCVHMMFLIQMVSVEVLVGTKVWLSHTKTIKLGFTCTFCALYLLISHSLQSTPTSPTIYRTHNHHRTFNSSKTWLDNLSPTIFSAVFTSMHGSLNNFSTCSSNTLNLSIDGPESHAR